METVSRERRRPSHDVLSGETADGYFRRGLAYLGAGKSAEAKADLNKFLELQPTGAQADLARKAVEQIK